MFEWLRAIDMTQADATILGTFLGAVLAAVMVGMRGRQKGAPTPTPEPKTPPPEPRDRALAEVREHRTEYRSDHAEISRKLDHLLRESAVVMDRTRD